MWWRKLTWWSCSRKDGVVAVDEPVVMVVVVDVDVDVVEAAGRAGGGRGRLVVAVPVDDVDEVWERVSVDDEVLLEVFLDTDVHRC